VEVYFPGSGWLTFDPTPPATRETTGLLTRMALYFDWFQLTWNEWVINYDFSRQTELAKNVSQLSTNWSKNWQRRLRQIQDNGMHRLAEWQRAHGFLRFVFPALLLLSLVLLRMGWLRTFLGWLSLRWEASLPAGERNNPQLAARLYAEFLRLLEKQGFSRAETQTPREFAASFALRPALAPAVHEFTDLYLEARFGGRPCDAFRLRALLETVRSVPRPS
jgi:protein-glutamine gamma-glutamyltransferase